MGLIDNLRLQIFLTAVMFSLGVCSVCNAQSSGAALSGTAETNGLLAAAFAEVDKGLEEDASIEIAVHQGVLAYQQEQYDAALLQLEKSGSKRIAASYFTVLCLIHLDRVDEALQVLTELRRNPDAPELIDVGVAQALIDAGNKAEGLDLLEEYAANHPDDLNASALLRHEQSVENPQEKTALPETLSAPDSLPEMSSDAPAERHWNLTFLTGYDYDSNVVRAPLFQGLGSEFQRADSSWINALYGDYRFVQEDDVVAGATASVFLADRFQMSEFDTFNVSGGAYINQSLGDVVVGGNYQFVNTLLGNDQFSVEHRLVGNVTLLEDTFGHSTAYYEFNSNDLNSAALIPAQEQSAVSNAVGLTQAVYLFEGAGRIFAGYRFGKNNADGDDFDFDSHMLTSRIEAPLNGRGWLSNWIGDAEVRIFFDRYANANSLDFMGNQRSDSRTEVRTGL